MSFQNLIEVLGISHQDANEENPAENKDENAGNSPENAENQENAGVELPGEVPDADNPDITEEISSAVLTLDDVAVSDVTRDFVADVESVVFSRPDLVDVSKAASETTVGGIKESRGLEVQYSAELTEEQIAEINAQTVEAGDWALISMQPFESEETLTVTMKNGEQFVVKVTDAQIVTDSATFKTAERFVIAYVTDAGKYIVLTSTGYCEEFDTPEDIDFLDSKYLWRFYYVFTEKDQNAANANYEYYFIRPTEDLTKSIALIDASDTELIQTGANNIAVIPQGNGTFIMEGYSSVGAQIGAYSTRTNPDHRINLTDNLTNTGTEADSTTAILYYKIMNNPGYELPNTGGPGTSLFYLLGIMLTGAGCYGCFMSKKRKIQS